MGFLPSRPAPTPDDGSPIELAAGERAAEEDRERRSVEAAGRRAREIADEVFGAVSRASLSGVGFGGPFRGLLRLDVPYLGICVHRAREARFLAAVGDDELLTRVPLLFVVGPDEADTR